MATVAASGRNYGELPEGYDGATALDSASAAAAIRQNVLLMGRLVDRCLVRAAGAVIDGDGSACDAVVSSSQTVRVLSDHTQRLAGATSTGPPVSSADPASIQVLPRMASRLARAGEHCAAIADIARSLPDDGRRASAACVPQLADAYATTLLRAVYLVADRQPDVHDGMLHRDGSVPLDPYPRLCLEYVHYADRGGFNRCAARQVAELAAHLGAIGAGVDVLEQEALFLRSLQVSAPLRLKYAVRPGAARTAS